MCASLLITMFFIIPVRAGAPYLVVYTEFDYRPLLDKSPYGRLNLIVPISKLMDDGVSNYEWYFYEIRLQTVPGIVSYGSNWETAETYAKHIVYSAGSARWLVDYGPTTTSGETTVTVSVSAGGGPFGGPSAAFSTSWSYSVPYVKVLDYSDFMLHRAYWKHDFDEQWDPEGSPSDTTYYVKPSFVVRTKSDPGTQTPSLVDAWYKVTWAHQVLWWWTKKSFESPTLYLDTMRVRA